MVRLAGLTALVVLQQKRYATKRAVWQRADGLGPSPLVLPMNDGVQRRVRRLTRGDGGIDQFEGTDFTSRDERGQCRRIIRRKDAHANHSVLVLAAVDNKALTAHETRIVREQEAERAVQVFGLHDSPERCAGWVIGAQGSGTGRGREARSDRIRSQGHG
jgi:hypothetical protein